MAWAFYWAGDLACRLHRYRAYQFLMGRAARIQGDGKGPWIQNEGAAGQ